VIPPLYDRLAELWPLISPPEIYAQEGELYASWLEQAAGGSVSSLLELGAGGGHLASAMPVHWELTLVDLAPRMLDIARQTVPRARHVLGDMRSIDLDRRFDAVLLQDAVMYLCTEDDLRAAFATAARHLRPGGAFLVLPDLVAETFEEHSSVGGRADGPRAVQLLEWHWDPNPDDTTYQVEYAMLFREPDGTVRCHHASTPWASFPPPPSCTCWPKRASS
jgi:SAM-dependent methyltransferase